jgi:hypothetical protein
MKRPLNTIGRQLGQPLTTELLVMPDGKILVHNLTPAFAALLRELNPTDRTISSRVPTVQSAPAIDPQQNSFEHSQ